MKLGIMAAMPEEIESLFGEFKSQRVEDSGLRKYHDGTLLGVPCTMVFSRWGKVAAASTATHLISRFGVTDLLFTGVAGAIHSRLKLGDIVIGTELVQHDMDASPLFKPHEIPLLGVSTFHTNEAATDRLKTAATHFLAKTLDQFVSPALRTSFQIKEPRIYTGLIASGDQFFASKEKVANLRKALPETLCVEMEGAAVAQVCHEYGIPFSIMRTISDSADESAHIDFPKFVREVASAYSHGVIDELSRAISRK